MCGKQQFAEGVPNYAFGLTGLSLSGPFSMAGAQRWNLIWRKFAECRKHLPSVSLGSETFKIVHANEKRSQIFTGCGEVNECI